MKVFFLLPIYNDQNSLNEIIRKIKVNFENKNYELKFLIINDGSSSSVYSQINNKADTILIDLKSNQGNQKAIHTGMMHLIKEKYEFDYLIVMDSDGEDDPDHVEKLLEESKIREGEIIFASRLNRHESIVFKFFYVLYKIIFKILTGKKISFGNFSCIPKNLLKSLTSLPMIDCHYPSAIIKSKILFSTVPLDKGKRFDGKSSMNLINFILHAMKSLSVFYEQIIARFLIFTFIGMIFCIFTIIIVFIYKFSTPLILAGWSTNVVIGFSIIGLIFLFMFFSCLLVLINKNTFLQNRNINYKDLIKKISEDK